MRGPRACGLRRRPPDTARTCWRPVTAPCWSSSATCAAVEVDVPNATARVRGRGAVGGRHRRDRTSRVGAAGGLFGRRGCGRLLHRRRAQLARPQVRPGVQQRSRGRARECRRRVGAGGRDHQRRPVLGGARWGRLVRCDHRDRARRCIPVSEALRRRDAVADRARPRGRCRRGASWVDTVPDEVTSLVRLLHFPPMPDIPEPFRGRAFVGVEAACLLRTPTPVRN